MMLFLCSLRPSFLEGHEFAPSANAHLLVVTCILSSRNVLALEPLLSVTNPSLFRLQSIPNVRCLFESIDVGTNLLCSDPTPR